MSFRLKALIPVVFLLSLMYSCSDDSSSTPASAVIVNGQQVTIDSVSNVYIGNGEAYCYFWEKDDKDHIFPVLLVCVSNATYQGLMEGSYNYKKSGLTSKYFYAVNLTDTIKEGSLTISKTDKAYKFSFSFSSDSLKFSGYSESKLYLKDISGRMIIGGQRFEERSGAIAMYEMPDTMILSIMGSKLSFPQLSLHIPCISTKSIESGTYVIDDNMTGKIYLSSKSSATINSGELHVTKDLDEYEFQYSFIYNDSLVYGYYKNTIIFRQ